MASNIAALEYPSELNGPALRTIIEADSVRAEQQRGVHSSYIITDESGAEHFFKSYVPTHKPLLMLAERLAHRFADRSAALFHRAPLAGYFTDPLERSLKEAHALRRWAAYGIDAPKVLGYDRTGIYLERLNGTDLAERLSNGTLTEQHRDTLTEHLHRAREAALTIDDASFLHCDPSLENAIGSDDGRVWLIDPGVLTKQLPISDLDAAFSLSYLAHLHALGTAIDERAITDDFAERYVAGLGPNARATIREHAVPVPDRLISMLRTIPDRGVRAYAQWLAHFSSKQLEQVTGRL